MNMCGLTMSHACLHAVVDIDSVNGQLLWEASAAARLLTAPGLVVQTVWGQVSPLTATQAGIERGQA
jgi:hypothetical protein